MSQQGDAPPDPNRRDFLKKIGIGGPVAIGTMLAAGGLSVGGGGLSPQIANGLYIEQLPTSQAPAQITLPTPPPTTPSTFPVLIKRHRDSFNTFPEEPILEVQVEYNTDSAFWKLSDTHFAYYSYSGDMSVTILQMHAFGDLPGTFINLITVLLDPTTHKATEVDLGAVNAALTLQGVPVQVISTKVDFAAVATGYSTISPAENFALSTLDPATVGLVGFSSALWADAVLDRLAYYRTSDSARRSVLMFEDAHFFFDAFIPDIALGGATPVIWKRSIIANAITIKRITVDAITPSTGVGNDVIRVGDGTNFLTVNLPSGGGTATATGSVNIAAGATLRIDVNGRDTIPAKNINVTVDYVMKP